MGETDRAFPTLLFGLAFEALPHRRFHFLAAVGLQGGSTERMGQVS